MSIWFEKVGVTGSSTRGEVKKVSFRSDLSSGCPIATIAMKDGSVSSNYTLYSPERSLKTYFQYYYPYTESLGFLFLDPHNGGNIPFPLLSNACFPDFTQPSELLSSTLSDEYTYTALSSGFIKFSDQFDSTHIYPDGYEISGMIDGTTIYDTYRETTELPDILESIDNCSINQLIVPIKNGSVVKVGYVNAIHTNDPNFKLTFYPIKVLELNLIMP